MKPVIRAEGLGKKYLIRHEHPERYAAFRDVLARQLKKIFSFPKHLRPQPAAVDFEEFWALKDLNFDIYPGDRVGIIGRNGAGKSTLLKILSRITEPSTGRVELNGRVASLLEVGTGFHPELSGRENIFLNGAILGMSRAEIRRKFDEIVDFSGVEKFLDTPVKRYSSGMYVRLAFAVAAHLEPEILVVDEVLAVGDAEFQKKCLGKMEEVSNTGSATVIFVSHNIHNLLSLCNRGILLENGGIRFSGSIAETTSVYSSEGKHALLPLWENLNKAYGDVHFLIKKLCLTDSTGVIASRMLRTDQEIYLNICGEIGEFSPNLKIGFFLYDSSNTLVFTSFINGHTDENLKFERGTLCYKCKLPLGLLVTGEYHICFFSGIYYQKWICKPPDNCPVIYFNVMEAPSDAPFWHDRERGVVQPEIQFIKI